MSSEIVRTLAALVASEPSEAGPGRGESSESAKSAAVQPDGGTAAVDSSVADAAAPERSPVESFPKNFHQILHLTKAPMFVTDAEGDVLVWNQGMEELTGSDEAAARAADQISTAWYHDGRRSMTLADKIIDTNPGRREEATPTDEEYDVERVGWVDYELYQDESTFTDAEGTTRHIRFSAAPLYEDGRFVGVVEYVEDRTEDVRRQQDLERLVTELTETLTAVGSGDLGARADSLDLSHVDDRLAGVTESLNDTVSRLEEFVAETAADSEELQSSTEGIAARAESINDAAAEQLSSLRDVSDEVENTSASAEEIAATTDEVSANAAEAVEEAQAGDEAATAADETMQDVAESTEQVVTDVRSLQERMEEIDEVIEVINGIAEQTNMLALNASIEAARAGEAGEGFAVVADEIKQLATESQRHADDIEAMITSIRDDTERTVDSLFTVSDQVHTAREEVDRVQRSIDTVVDEIETTADGIEQVATVTDEQAATSEEVASMIGDVVEAAEAIADDTDTIAAQNQAHADLADRIDRNLEQLTGDR